MKYLTLTLLALMSSSVSANMPIHRFIYSSMPRESRESDFNGEVDNFVEIKKDLIFPAGTYRAPLTRICDLVLKKGAERKILLKSGKYHAVYVKSVRNYRMYGEVTGDAMIQFDHPIVQGIECSKQIFVMWDENSDKAGPSEKKVLRWLKGAIELYPGVLDQEEVIVQP